MNFLNSIPRGLIVFVAGIVVIAILVWGYVSLFGGGNANSATSGGSFFSTLFPFGNTPPPSGGASAGSTALTDQGQSGSVPLLREVSAAPVSGGWFAAAPAAESPRIRYMLRESGHVEETPADSFTENRISNTTLPGVEELEVATSSAVVLRVLDDSGAIKNFYGRLNATSSQESITVSPIPNFSRAAVGGGEVLAVTPHASGASIDLMNPDGSGKRTLLTSPISSWVPVLGGTHAFLETAPSAEALGYLYDIAGGSLVKIAGGITGMTAIASPSGRYVAVSGNTPGGFALEVIDTKTKTPYATPLKGFALKCAWIPNREPLLFCAVPDTPPAAAYPDDWLMGNVPLADEAWIVNPVGNTSFFIGALTDENGVDIDAENVSVDPTGSYALFMNKRDLSLWSLRIAEVVARTTP